MSGEAKAITEFARNEMVRADHTISWAGDVESASATAEVFGFQVRYLDRIFFVVVYERPK